MNRLPTADRVAVLRALTEGCSLRSTARMTGVAFNTVVKLLVNAGRACAEYQHDAMRNLTCQRLQLDEIWAFVGMKDRNIPAERAGEEGIGSVWTWTAIDADTKIVPSWLVGLRDAEHATAFVTDLAGRLANRVQVTTDGLKVYLEAMEAGFGGAVDYAMLQKHYGRPGDNTNPDTRYSPAECVGCDKKGVSGRPDPAHVSTSYVERQNLNMRMRMRRFTRLTNAFSKKLANHEAAIAMYFFAYNFIVRHGTLRMPPALKAGVTDHVWSYEELVDLIDRDEQRNRGSRHLPS